MEQLIEKMSGTDAWTWVKQNAQSIVKPESWPRKLLTVNIAEWWPEYKTWLEERVPDLSRWILAQVDERVEALVRSINLPELVEREVIRFPVGRLEDLILKVTGKEFRAITWFGALIGGLIGFVQSVLILYVLEADNIKTYMSSLSHKYDSNECKPPMVKPIGSCRSLPEQGGF